VGRGSIAPVAFFAWWNKAGAWLLMLATGVSLVFLGRDLGNVLEKLRFSE
jgi:hypothetical protein